MKPRRVVLDTNCLISALIFSRNTFAWMREGWQRRRLIPLASRDTVSELIRVLSYPKFRLDKEAQEALLADFLPYAETVRIGNLREDIPTLRDPDDAIFLISAATAHADALVSGDADIQVVKDKVKGFVILTPAEFESWLSGQEET